MLLRKCEGLELSRQLVGRVDGVVDRGRSQHSIDVSGDCVVADGRSQDDTAAFAGGPGDGREVVVAVNKHSDSWHDA